MPKPNKNNEQDTIQLLGYAIDKLEANSVIQKAIGKEDVDVDMWFICSTETPDAHNEVIEQDGWLLENFRRNPVMLSCHQHRTWGDAKPTVVGSWPIVKVVSIKLPTTGKQGKALVGGVKFASTDLGKEFKTLYDEKHMRAVSVSLQPMEGGQKEIGGQKRYAHTKQDLVEISAVAVGANYDALLMNSRQRAADAPQLEGESESKILQRLDELAASVQEYHDDVQLFISNNLSDDALIDDDDEKNLGGDDDLDGEGGMGGKSTEIDEEKEPKPKSKSEIAAQELRDSLDL